jgi:hypothetical protein
MRNLKTMTRDDWRGVGKVLAEARYLQIARFSENANTAGELASLYERERIIATEIPPGGEAPNASVDRCQDVPSSLMMPDLSSITAAQLLSEGMFGPALICGEAYPEDISRSLLAPRSPLWLISQPGTPATAEAIHVSSISCCVGVCHLAANKSV